MSENRKSNFYNKHLNYKDFLDLIKSAQSGDLDSKNKLIKLNIGLVKKEIMKYLSSGLDVEDLFQLGCIGLLKAIDRFNPSLGYMFSSYAVPLIDGEIRRFVRDDGIIKISRELKTINWKVKKLRDNYTKKTGKELSLDEISKNLDIPIDKIKQSFLALSPVEYFESYNSEKKFFQLDLENNVLKEKEFSYVDLIELKDLVDDLSEIEQKIIKMRYVNDFTQEKIGRILGMSQVQISRMEKAALLKLKKEYLS